MGKTIRDKLYVVYEETERNCSFMYLIVKCTNSWYLK